MRRAGVWARRRGRAFSPELRPTLARVQALLDTCSPGLRRWLTLNLALLTVAVLQLWRGARSGHGSLTLAALSRALPLEEGEKARSKRLARLLHNPHLVGSALTPLLIRLVLGPRPRGWVPIVLDQTTLRGTPTLLAGVRVAGRILPVAFACFEYATLRKSQNALEFALLLLVKASLPRGCTPLFVLDRGYARVALLAQLRQAGIPYLVRGRSNTLVRLGGQRLALGRVPHRGGQAVRYRQVAYQNTKRELVDLIVFRDPALKEPWYLLVPPESARRLPTATVVALYRQRMHIELTFRDWKTHLGVRGLRLEVDIAPRLERLLLALTVAYTLAVLLGAGPAARRVREDCEILRATPRHGTRRRLSALLVGILLLSLTRFAALAARALTRLLAALARGTPAVALAVCPP
jgi:DDE family transposase